jgi:branched-chain amino acid transport system permease protein
MTAALLRLSQRRSPNLVTDYRQDVRLFRSRLAKLGVIVLLLLWLFLPLQADDFWLGVCNYIAVVAIGGIGLNLLTGFTGQVSLGQAFFMACGAFTAAFLGSKHEWPFLAWLLAAAVIGGLIGALIGPIALRLQGNYLAIVTLGLLFVGDHVFSNWTTLTGGGRGVNVRAPFAIGPVDFANLDVLGQRYTRTQGLFWLMWILVAIVALIGKNVVRSRPGRAMQAVRDRDIAAEIVGISLLRYKLGAFALSSALAAMSGALYAAVVQQFITPAEFGGTFGLVLSIQFLAVIIIGGMGTIYGSILGAIVVGGLPRVIDKYSSSLPFLSATAGDGGLISVASFNNILFGVLVIVFLLVEPLGLAAFWRRLSLYFKTWPFSY